MALRYVIGGVFLFILLAMGVLVARSTPAMDFPAFYYAGLDIRNGQNPYAQSVHREVEYFLPPYIYPPPFAQLLALLPNPGLIESQRIFLALSLLLTLVLPVAVTWPRNGAKALEHGIAAVCALGISALHCVYNGQVGIILAFGLALALAALRSGKPMLAGIALAFPIALKLTPGIFTALAIRRGFVPFAAGAALTVGTIVSLSWMGDPLIWGQFLEQYRRISGSGVVDAGTTVDLFSNTSLVGLLDRFGLAAGRHAQIGTYWLALCAAAILWLGWRCRGEERSWLPISVLAVLSSPLVWGHHWVLAIPGVAAYFRTAPNRRHMAATVALLALVQLPYGRVLSPLPPDLARMATLGVLAFQMVLVILQVRYALAPDASE